PVVRVARARWVAPPPQAAPVARPTADRSRSSRARQRSGTRSSRGTLPPAGRAAAGVAVATPAPEGPVAPAGPAAPRPAAAGPDPADRADLGGSAAWARRARLAEPVARPSAARST